MFILFVKKPDGSFWLYVNYRDLNYIIIKNVYFLPLIDESLDWLGSVKSFIRLDWTSIYHRMYIQKGDK